MDCVRLEMGEIFIYPIRIYVRSEYLLDLVQNGVVSREFGSLHPIFVQEIPLPFDALVVLVLESEPELGIDAYNVSALHASAISIFAFFCHLYGQHVPSKFHIWESVAARRVPYVKF